MHNSNDLYLTASPQITFFKSLYRRHTNFASELIEFKINNINFGKEAECTFDKIGDLIHKMYIEITLPKVHLTKEDLGIDTNYSIKSMKLLQHNKDLQMYKKYYDIVASFTEINVEAYNLCISDLEASNITKTSVLFDTIKDHFNDLSYSDSIELFNSTLKLFNLNPLYTSILERFSHLQKYIALSSENFDTLNQETKKIIKKELNSCLDNNKSIINYFYEKISKVQTLIDDLNSPFAKFAWFPNVGENIIDYVDIYIGEERIERHYGTWLHIYNELFGNYYHKTTYSTIIGNSDSLCTFDRKAKPTHKIYIPMAFWFTKNPHSAFPIASLQYNTFKLVIKLKDLYSCCYIESSNVSLKDVWEEKNLSVSCKVIANYIFLDRAERLQFIKSAHEYLIENVDAEFITNINQPKIRHNINFRGPTKDIFWIVTKDSYNDNSTGNCLLHPHCFGVGINNNRNPIKKFNINLNGYKRLFVHEDTYYSMLVPYMQNLNVTQRNINMYSFCLNSSELQPSGTINLSVITNVNLEFDLDENVFVYDQSDITPDKSDKNNLSASTAITITIFARRYNVLRVASGYAALAYH